MEKIRVGFAMCGSFCSFVQAIEQMQLLVDGGYSVVPIMSQTAYYSDTKFGKAAEFVQQIEEVTGKQIIKTLQGAEPIGPKRMLDVLLVEPCTGNTLGKITGGITDTPVTMAAKSHLRIERPLLLAIATNDALAGSARNMGTILNTKNVYFVPMSQDDPLAKPHSLVAHFDLTVSAIEAALAGHQLQPVLR